MEINNKKGFIIMMVIILITILIYLIKPGGENYIFITDLLAVVYSFSAILFGIYAIKIYSPKSLQGRALALITAGIASWFIAELVWLIFSVSAKYYSEFFRFLGYVPLILAFFGVLYLSDPSTRRNRKKTFCALMGFLIFTILYLNIVPMIFGGTSILNSILTRGYVVADFILLFGVFLLLRTSLKFKKGSMSYGGLIIALAFILVFIFDVYFAFYSEVYISGSFIEVFWLSSYLLLAYGFFYYQQIMKNFLRRIKGIEKDATTKKLPIVGIILILLFLFSIILFYFYPSEPNTSQEYGSFTVETRNDVSLIITQEVVNNLNKNYSFSDKEYLFCLIGNKTSDKIYIYDLAQPELHYQGSTTVIPEEDPTCRISNSMGSIHSHLNGTCKPSSDDLFTWGEMKDPEPVINAIQCGEDSFYVMLMPEKHQALDFRSLKLEII